MAHEYHPHHIYQDNTVYFITASTLDQEKLFNTDKKKELFKEIFNRTATVYKIAIYAWVILSNHYHLLIKVTTKEYLYKFIKSLHGNSAIQLNKLEDTPGRQVWYQYWDKCIRSEKDFWMRFNYIHQNGVKHGYARRIKDYLFSSYNHYLKKYGLEWLTSCFEQYPIKDFTVKEDNF